MLSSFRRPTLAVLPLAAAAMLLAGCDDDNETTAPAPQTFTATLSGLNGQTVNGTATFTIDGDDVTAVVNATGTAPSTMHAQHIHFAAGCPTAAADANSDGYVDVLEGVPSYGLILVPLDDDLSSQSAGGTYPTADANGAITYTETTSLATMLADLRASDPDDTDAITKLSANGDLDLSGRAVVLHGVASSTNLPGTVQTIANLPATATLPIACGAIN